MSCSALSSSYRQHQQAVRKAQLREKWVEMLSRIVTDGSIFRHKYPHMQASYTCSYSIIDVLIEYMECFEAGMYTRGDTYHGSHCRSVYDLATRHSSPYRRVVTTVIGILCYTSLHYNVSSG